MKYLLTLIFINLFNISCLFSQKITLILETKTSEYHSNYFFASNLTGWSPNDTSYKFSKLNNTKLSLVINDFKNINHIEFKITKGNWQSVECNVDGSPLQNRYFIVNKIKSDTTIYIKVDNWRDDFDLQHPKSTASKNVKILSNDFYLKSLGVKRRVWIYLPNGYDGSKDKYKVLYMHDGQNLFDVLTAPFGEWGVDEALDTLNKNLIVVGIDNGSAERLSEYSAFDFRVNADAKNVWDVKAKGKLYLESIVNDLMPYV
ncbi:MAG: alpha/beta hydrolase-fold protein, partial [bacterium]